MRKTKPEMQDEIDTLIQQTFEQHHAILELYQFIRLAERELRHTGYSKEVNAFIKKYQYLEEVPF